MMTNANTQRTIDNIMWAEKQKHSSSAILNELLPTEEILWMDRPVIWKLFTTYDLFLIPFSLFWCAITLPLLFSGLLHGNLIGILLPHGWIGLYMLFGRFIFKVIRKQHTFYAVTNQRVLILSTLFGRRLQAFSLGRLPASEKVVGRRGIGTITFLEPPRKSWWGHRNNVSYANTGMDLFGGAVPGMYDIRDVDEVYRLIAEMSHETSYSYPEKSKPVFLPR